MKNCCDYDAIVHYPSGEFSRRYKTSLIGKVEAFPVNQPLDKQIIDSFQNGRYQTCRTIYPVVLYRLYGQYQKEKNGHPQGARLHGRYVSTEFAESIIDAKIRLALDPGWLNTKMYEAKLLVPPGITLHVGLVASIALPTGSILSGGAEQILLPPDWPDSWITGYRRVTARQLQIPPQYWPNRPDSIIQGKENLYSAVCPRCGYEHTERLAEDEQFEMIGRKGNRYVMKHRCLHPDCGYYW